MGEKVGVEVDVVSRLLRELAPQVLTRVVRRWKDFYAAEDAVQEALLAAAQQWPQAGLPREPLAWLTHVASRRVIDEVRAEAARRHREQLVVSWVPFDELVAYYTDSDVKPERDDSLELLFLCCHASLTTASAIALTLRAIGGLTTAEIARAYFVPETTMAQRITRAKEQIRGSATPLSLLSESEFKRRLTPVRHTIYLMFNEGYVTSEGPELQRPDLCSEAIRLARRLQQLVPDDAETVGLLSLLLLTDARRAARTGPLGELIPLDEQDRSLWDRRAISEGCERVASVLGKGQLGAYQVQAAIAALHDEAERVEGTDWPQILALYHVLQEFEENPMVKVNTAVAAAMVHGPGDPRLTIGHRLEAVRAHLLERAGLPQQAVQHFQRAAARTESIAERNYLLLRAARVAEKSK
jgi:RNA polymerase sigma factor (sigma-70 family)